MLMWLFTFLLFITQAIAAPTLGDDPVDINPMSLAYEFEVVDWTVPGIEPIEIKRHYSSGRSYHYYCGWDFWPHTVYDFKGYEKPDGYKRILSKGSGDFPNMKDIQLMEPNGGVLTYERFPLDAVLFTPPDHSKELEAFCFVPKTGGEDALSGLANVRNNRLYIEADTHNMTVIESSGNTRYYKHTDHVYRLAFEQRPNGHRVVYTYDTDDRVASVKTTDASGQKTYASIECENSGDKIIIRASDGQKLAYEFETFWWWFSSSPKRRRALNEVRLGSLVVETYGYKKAAIERGCFLALREVADGRKWQIDYLVEDTETLADGTVIESLKDNDERWWRVKQIRVPDPQKQQSWMTLYTCQTLGEEQTNVAWVNFHRTGTEITHAAGAKTVLHFEGGKPPHAQEDFLNGALHSKTAFHRDAENRLTGQELFDARGNLQTRRTFTYDSSHNVTVEKAEANFSGAGLDTYEKRYEYSAAHLPTRIIEPGGVETRIEYKPNTNLVVSRNLLLGGRVHKRELFVYDSENNLVEVVEDDGDAPTQRTYKRLTPRLMQPAIGLPEWVEEGYVDLASGQRVVIRKTRTLYNDACTPAKEELYDAHGKFCYALTFQYDALGHLAKKTDPLGRTSTYAYDLLGRLVEEREPGAPVRRRTHLWQGKLSSISEQTETQLFESYSYDVLQRKITITTSTGATRTLTFAPTGHIIHDSKKGSFEYDLLGHLVAETRLDGSRTTYETTVHNKRSRIIYPDGSSTTHRYALNGSLASSTLEDGTRIVIDHDPLGRPLRKRIFASHGGLLSDESWTYSAYHLLTHTDSAGNIRTFSYDGAGRKIGETLSSSHGISRTTYIYDTLGRLAETQQLLSHGDLLKTIFVTDFLGRITEERQEDGRGHTLSKVATSYDAAGNATRVERLTAAGTAVDVTTHDLRKRPLKHTDPLGRIESYIYQDGKAPCITHTDVSGIVTETHYDQDGLMCDRHSTGGPHERFEYDLLGRKIRHTTEGSFTLQWSYDALGRVTELREGNQITRYAYDARGRLTELTRPSGKKLFKTYDGLGRLITLKSSDGTVEYLYSYGSLDQPTNVQDPLHGITIRRSYTSLGLLSREETPAGSVQKAYDPWSRCTQLTLPDGSTIHYDYAPAHLRTISRKTSSGALLYTHEAKSWDTNGSTLSEHLSGGLGELVHQNDLGQRPQSTSSPYFAEQIDAQDTAGRPTLARSNLFGASNWSYDLRGHLAEERSPFVGHQYAYDLLDNRIAQDRAPWSVDSLNRLQATPSDRCDYDADGQLVVWNGALESWRFEYDALGRLTNAIRSDGLAVRSTYDPWHRRLIKQVVQGHITKELRFFYNGEQELGACARAGQITELRVLNGDPRPTAVAIELEGQPLTPLHDLRGNLVALAAMDTKSVVATYAYSAFGECKASGSVKSPWRFAGQRVDDETSLVVFGKRYYHPRFARWITPDPAGFVDGLNLYAYVHNDPINCYDPDGTFTFSAEFIIPTRYGTIRLGNNSYPVQAFRWSMYGVGWCTKLFADHIVFVPVIKEAVRCLGSVLCLEMPLLKLQTHGVVFLESKHKVYNGRAYLFGGGILSDRSIDHVRRRIESDMRTQTSGIYFESYGFLGDVLETFCLWLGIATENVLKVQEHLEKIVRGLKDGEKLHIAGHSKGAVYLGSAIRRMSAEDRQKIGEFSCYGSPFLVPASPDIPTTNYVGDTDPIPMIDVLGNFKHSAGLGNYNVHTLYSDKLFKHDFMSAYYDAFRQQHCPSSSP